MFVVCGEALFDVFPAAPTPTGLALDARMGGSPFNVALGLARLGQPVQFVGGVSTGALGERLVQALQEEGVGTAGVQRLDAPTTLSVVELDRAGTPAYRFHGEGAADRLLPPAAAAHWPAGARALHVGSYALVVEPVAQTVRALVERARAQAAVVAYDPNVRLGVVPDHGAWRAALEWMAPRADVIKVSEEDLAALYPGDSPLALAQRWRAQGAAAVVVTRGEAGAWADVPGAVLALPAVPVDVVDTVGAGDTFQAALLTALAERGAMTRQALHGATPACWTEALAFAARAAALTCGRRGADLPRRSELGAPHRPT